MRIMNWLKNRVKHSSFSPPQEGRLPAFTGEWSEEAFTHYFQNSADFQIHSYSYTNTGITVAYCEDLCDTSQLSKIVLPAFEDVFQSKLSDEGISSLQTRLQMKRISSEQDMLASFFSGSLLILVSELNQLFAYEMSKIPKRNPEESASEVSLIGPRDGFTEELSTNVALIRKRLQTTKLCNEQFILGSQSHTKVSLLYLEDIVSSDLIQEARRRLQQFKGDALLSSSQLEESLGDTKYCLFPLLEHMGRPDSVAAALLRGRFAVLVNGSPMALIAPSNLTEQLKSPEDLHLPYYFVAFERLLRLSGLLTSLFLPGFWIALSSYHFAQFPFRLLATVVISRIGLPFNPIMEFILINWMFELLLEAGKRLPKAVGQTVSVVGGLIVGDAAIRAGLASPTMIVIVAVTAVASFTLVNQSLTGTVSILRNFVILGSSFLGLFGLFVCMFIIIIYLSGKTSFGIGYLEPISPLRVRQILKALLDAPKTWKEDKSKFVNQALLDWRENKG